MTPGELLAQLQSGGTPEERQRLAISFASYQAFLAGVRHGAEHGVGEWDEGSDAWSEWADANPVVLSPSHCNVHSTTNDPGDRYP